MIADNGLVDPILGLDEAADLYLSLGLAVLPLKPGGKEPATRKGVKDAIHSGLVAEDRADRARRWHKDESLNLAVATGIVVDVLDVDVKNGKPGLRAVAALESAGLLRGCVAIAQTPSGGLHYYFPAASGARSGAVAFLGLDYQASGKYVVAPPSSLLVQHEVGAKTLGLAVQSYRWLWSRAVDQGEPFDWAAAKSALGVRSLPARTRSRSYAPQELGDVVERMARWVAEQPANRNSALYWAACRVWESGVTDIEELTPLVDASLALTGPDERIQDRESELWKTVASARGAEA